MLQNNRISRDQALMNEAVNQSRRGTCGRLQVGAVISRDGRVISSGYNGPVSGAAHCSDGACDKTQSCTRSVHAESNAIVFAAKLGTAIDGCTLHTTHTPCPTCADLIINSGIKRVVYLEYFRDGGGLSKLCNHPGIVVEKYDAQRTG